MGGSVVDEVGQDLLEPAPVDLPDPHRRAMPGLGGIDAAGAANATRQRRDVDRFAGSTGWSLRASSSRSVTRCLEPVDLVGDQGRGGCRSVSSALRAAGEHAGRRGEGLQRRAQFVADVGGEPAVAFDPRGQLVDHLVERGGQPGQIGLGGRVEAGVEVTGGDLLGGVGHSGQRPQHVAGGVPAERRAGSRRYRRRRGSATSASTCRVWSSSRSESTS